MRYTSESICWNPTKAHLWGLPNMETAPPPVEHPSKRGLLIFPLFRGGADTDLAHHDAQAACWARHTWLSFSDARDFGIEAKFYVEEQCQEQVEAVFEQNHILSEDVVYFEADHLEDRYPDGSFTGYGKRAAFYTDKRFKEYEWIVQADTDIFVMSGKKEKFPFFQPFFDACQEPIIGSLGFNNRGGLVQKPFPNIDSSYWIYRVFPHNYRSVKTDDEYVAEWLRRAKDLVGENAIKPFYDSSLRFAEPHTGISTFPARYFMKHRWEDCEWLSKAGRELQAIESPLSLWSAMGHPVFDMEKEMELQLISLNSMGTPRGYEKFVEYSLSETPFLFHYHYPLIELMWRREIGAL